MKIERYLIKQDYDKISIHVQQSQSGFGILLLTIVILIASWYFGPYGGIPKLPTPFYWIITVFFLFVAVAAFVAMFYKEKYLLTTHKIMWGNNFGSRSTVSFKENLQSRLEIASRKARRRGGRVYPYKLILLDEAGEDSPITFDFQRKKNVRQFVRRLGEIIPFQVVEVIEEDVFNRRKLDNWF